jgi:Holliday junction resolvase RusA-like endonuclease
MRLTINIDPVPASRPRTVKIGRGKKARTMSYYKQPYKGFKAKAEGAVKAALPAGHKLIDLKRMIVRVLVTVQKPKTSELDDPMPDVDNYLKAVFDACNGVVWIDDRWVKRAVIEKQWGKKGRIDMEIVPYART